VTVEGWKAIAAELSERLGLAVTAEAVRRWSLPVERVGRRRPRIVGDADAIEKAARRHLGLPPAKRTR
jgi:hypothetical protein